MWLPLGYEQRSNSQEQASGTPFRGSGYQTNTSRIHIYVEKGIVANIHWYFYQIVVGSIFLGVFSFYYFFFQI